jgi:hypothetical protein
MSGQVERMNRTIKEATSNTFITKTTASVATSRGFHRRVYLRPSIEGSQRADALRVHLQMLDFRARPIHPRSDQPNAGTEHLGLSVALPDMKLIADLGCGEVSNFFSAVISYRFFSVSTLPTSSAIELKACFPNRS